MIDTWYGELPERWASKRVAAILINRRERNDPIKTDYILSLSSKSGVIPYSERTEKGGNKPKDDLTKYSIARNGDLLVNCMNVLSGSSGVTKWDGAISPVYYALYPRNKEVNIWYYNYIFRLVTFYRSLIGLGKGILFHESESGSLNTIRLRIAMTSLNNVMLPLPPRDEQDQIVRYLDWKVSRINKLINAKRKQIELLEEQRRRIIDNFISDVKGTEHRFRYLFTLSKGLGITKSDLKDEGVPCVSYGEVHSKYGFEVNPDTQSLKCVDESYLEISPKSLLGYGDFVFADTSEDIEGSGNFTYLKSHTKTFAGYHTIIARANKPVNYRYFAYFFDSNSFRSQIQREVNGVKVYSITRGILNRTVIQIPADNEQEHLVSTLDKQCSYIDQIILKLNDEITLLTEYRTRLISDVVTGKLDVRDVVVPEYEAVEDVSVDMENAEDEDSEQ